MIRILLVDDHPVMGEGTKELIEKEADMKVTLVTSSVEAVQLMDRETFDLYLFDLYMPVISGLELTRRAYTQSRNTPILIYSGYDLDLYFNLLVEAGACGFISKASSGQKLLSAIRCAIEGDTLIPISLLRQLRRNEATVELTDGSSVEPVSISKKEQEILQLVSKGKSNKELASILLMSQRTIEHHLTRIFEKLQVHSRTEAVARAKQLGLIIDQNLL